MRVPTTWSNGYVGKRRVQGDDMICTAAETRDQAYADKGVRSHRQTRQTDRQCGGHTAAHLAWRVGHHVRPVNMTCQGGCNGPVCCQVKKFHLVAKLSDKVPADGSVGHVGHAQLARAVSASMPERAVVASVAQGRPRQQVMRSAPTVGASPPEVRAATGATAGPNI